MQRDGARITSKSLILSVLWGPAYTYVRSKLLSHKKRSLLFATALVDILKTTFSLLYLVKLSSYYYPWLYIHKTYLIRKLLANEVQFKYFSMETLTSIFPIALFLVRIGQWWRDNGSSNINLLLEDNLRLDQKLNDSEPPSILAPRDSTKLPNKKQCFICKRQPCLDPSSIPSGYVFCYMCILYHIKQEGKCPISLVSYDENQIRKVYY